MIPAASMAQFYIPRRRSLPNYLIVTALDAPDRQGNIKKAAAVLKLRKDKEGNIEVADIASAYARDNYGAYKKAIEAGKLKYLDKERAEEWAKLEGDTILQLLSTNKAPTAPGAL